MRNLQSPANLMHTGPYSQAAPFTFTQESAVQHLVDDVGSELSRAGITYCILRAPETRRTDHTICPIDVLVSSATGFKDILAAFAPLHPAQIVQIQPEQTRLFLPVSDLYVQVNVFVGDIRWRSAGYLAGQQVLANSRSKQGRWEAQPVHRAYFLWLSHLLHEGSIPVHLVQTIEQDIVTDIGKFQELVDQAFGSEMAVQLVDLVMSHQIDRSELFASACRRSLVQSTFRHNPVNAVLGQLRHMLHDARQRLMPSGIEVALLGPDGAGKTSVVAEVVRCSSLGKMPYTEVHTRLGFRQTLPSLRGIATFFLRRPMPPDSTSIDPHGATPHRWPIWMLKFGYYTLDLWLARVGTSREVASGALLVQDRHLIELPIDSRRYRYVGPPILPMLFSRLVPHPKLVIILDAPAEVLQSRKQEVAFEETVRQLAAYRDLAGRHRPSFIIDAQQSFDEVVCQALSIINEFTIRQTQRRFYRTGVSHSPKLDNCKQIKH